MSSIDGNGVPALSLDAITWSTLGPVAGAPVEVRPVHSEAMPASCEPCAALLLSPSRTMTLFCTGASGASVSRKTKLVVIFGALPAAGNSTSCLFASVAPQNGRTQPHGVKSSTMYVGALPRRRRVAGQAAQERVGQRARARGLEEAPALEVHFADH